MSWWFKEKLRARLQKFVTKVWSKPTPMRTFSSHFLTWTCWRMAFPYWGVKVKTALQHIASIKLCKTWVNNSQIKLFLHNLFLRSLTFPVWKKAGWTWCKKVKMDHAPPTAQSRKCAAGKEANFYNMHHHNHHHEGGIIIIDASLYVMMMMKYEKSSGATSHHPEWLPSQHVTIFSSSSSPSSSSVSRSSPPSEINLGNLISLTVRLV